MPTFENEESQIRTEMSRASCDFRARQSNGTWIISGGGSVYVWNNEIRHNCDRPVVDLSPDSYRHVSGIPGVSELCWADVWSETAEEYRACNAPPVNSLGTCKIHERI